ncbi:hypothetical protein F4802DRAFT_3090 [Xylaria palmicola]|nr:hypothetical protein F4802DRAFT_3090 [Xylaria palmicola]
MPATTERQPPRYPAIQNTTLKLGPGQLQPEPTPTGIKFQSRFSPGPRDTDVQWSISNMELDELKEVFNLIHDALGHVPYAICGLAALVDHRLARRKINKISIICPQESKDNVKSWAATRGYVVYGDSIGLPTSRGLVRRVRIKYAERGFEGLERVRSSLGDEAVVLSPASQLDLVALAYLDSRRRGEERALATAGTDLLFCLERVATRRIHLDPRFLPTFLGEEFFGDFTARFPGARSEMARAGIDISSVLARHNAATAIREHDEVLETFGAPRGSQQQAFTNHQGAGGQSREPVSRLQPRPQSPMRRSRSGSHKNSSTTSLGKKSASLKSGKKSLGLSSLGRSLTSPFRRN